jgi:hypothetical protein
MTDEEIRLRLQERTAHQTWKAVAAAVGCNSETLRQFVKQPHRNLHPDIRAAVLRYLTPVELPPTIAEEILFALGHARETVRLLEAITASGRQRDEAALLELRAAAANAVAAQDVKRSGAAAARRRTSAAE